MSGYLIIQKTHPFWSIFFIWWDSNIVPLWDNIPQQVSNERKTKSVFLSEHASHVAGRAGFEPATGFKAGTHLAGEPIQPLWHLPIFM